MKSRRIKIALWGFLFCFLASVPALAFQNTQKHFSIKLKEAPLGEALDELSKKADVNIAYAAYLVEGFEISCDLKSVSFTDALEALLQNTSLTYRSLSPTQIVLLRHQTSEKTTIHGIVVDAGTNQPLMDVNVFINGTMLGDATDESGKFRIAGLPAGRHLIIASRIGYKVEQRMLAPADTGRIEFKLQSKPLQAPTLEVTAGAAKEWRKDLKKFTKIFIGDSKNASRCKILNPEVLDFVKNKDQASLNATASAPLTIENRALGYRVHYILDYFFHQEEELTYTGKVRFEKLEPENPKELKKWEENREKTYQGSLRHFLSALYFDQLSEQGFYVSPIESFDQYKAQFARTPMLREEVLGAGRGSVHAATEV